MAIRLLIFWLIVSLQPGISEAGRPRPGETPDAPSVGVGLITDNTFSGSISECTKGGAPYPPGECLQIVRVVPEGAACSATPIAETGLTSDAQPWGVAPLTASTTYYLYGIAFEFGALNKAACSDPIRVSTTPNRPPLSPSLSGVVAPNNRTIEGNITPCIDDGLPALCSQQVWILDVPFGLCGPQCDCSPQLAVPVFGSAWSATSDFVIDGEESYYAYGVSFDGAERRCSEPVLVETPRTIAGCRKFIALQYGQCPGGCDTIRGARASWKVADSFATDWQYDGFTQSAVWMGVDGEDLSRIWVEAGVTRGFAGANVLAYFTAQGNRDGDFYERLLPGAPAIGQSVGSSLVNCQYSFPGSGCKPFHTTKSPRETVACVNGNCFHWDTEIVDIDGWVAPGPGSMDLAAGLEATCNTYPGNLLPPSSSNTTTVRNIEYRWGNQSWVQLQYLGSHDVFLLKDPSPSVVHGTDCCNGLQSGSNAECNAPVDFLHYFNSATPHQCAP